MVAGWVLLLLFTPSLKAGLEIKYQIKSSSHPRRALSPVRKHYLFSEECDLVVSDPVITRGLNWLWQQREPSYGFGDFTAKAITALQLANASDWHSRENLASELAVKQMEIELLVQLSRHHEAPLVPTEIAEYSLALNSLCLDPRQFHGLDLIGILNHHELLLDWEFAVSALAVCTSGSHVRKRQLRRLLDETESHENLNLETLSMVMIALNCIVHDHRNRNLQHYLSEPSKALGHMQKPDGSFGTMKSTALAVQALQATDPTHKHWNHTAAIEFLRNLQKEDGSFGKTKDIEGTIAVLLALGPRSLANIQDLNCNRGIHDYFSVHLAEFTLNLTMMNGRENKTTVAPVPLQNGSDAVSTSTQTPITTTLKELDGKIHVRYILWVENNASSVRDILISTEPGSNFYHVMQLAAEKDTDFAFQSTEWPNGHYIHTLSNLKEEPMTYRYWLLYKLPAVPSMDAPPTNQLVAPLGVDDLVVKHNDIYLFWYKKL